MNFKDVNFSDEIQKYVLEKHYTALTPVQAKTIPLILEKKDVLVIAPTGSGKTDAYLLPLMQLIVENKISQIIILVPTRELVLQIQKNLTYFKDMDTKSLCLFGEEKQGKLHIQNNPKIICSTPSKLSLEIAKKTIDVSKADCVVIDEVDKIVEESGNTFLKDILKKTSKQKNVHCFSATFTEKINAFSKQIQKNPELIYIETKHTKCEEFVAYVHEKNKIKLLAEYLQKKQVKKAIIFVNTKQRADQLKRDLNEFFSIKSEVLHSAKSQVHREKVMEKAHIHSNKIIIATDLAARGIDIEDVTDVIHYDVPNSLEMYVHRTGRTARAEKQGVSILFSSEKDIKQTKKIVQKHKLKQYAHAYHAHFEAPTKKNTKKKKKK